MQATYSDLISRHLTPRLSRSCHLFTTQKLEGFLRSLLQFGFDGVGEVGGLWLVPVVGFNFGMALMKLAQNLYRMGLEKVKTMLPCK